MEKKLFLGRVIFLMLLVSFFVVAPVWAEGLMLSPAFLDGQGVPGASGEFGGYMVLNGTTFPLQVNLRAVVDPNSLLLPAGEEWFVFQPASFVLAPGKEQKVVVTVSIPANTLPGTYETLVQAKAGKEGAEGLGVNLTLNARLKLTVGESALAQSQLVEQSLLSLELVLDKLTPYWRPMVVRKTVQWGSPVVLWPFFRLYELVGLIA